MDQQNVPMQEMPRYRCHKEVWALKIGDGITINQDGSAVLPVTDHGYGPVTVKSAVIARYIPTPGDYYVVYEDGYESISPAAAFESGYSRITGLAPLENVEARYADLLRRLGVLGHDGAVAEIAALRRKIGFE